MAKALRSCVFGALVATAMGESASIAMKYKPHICLDSGSRTDNGAPLMIWRCIDGDVSQQWFYDGATIRPAADTNKCIDAGGMLDGAGLYLWDCNGYGQQNWAYDENANTMYLTYSADASLCMGIDGGTTDGKPVLSNGCTGLWTQLWQFGGAAPTPAAPTPTPPVPPPAGSAALSIGAAGKMCVDAAGGVAQDGTQLIVWDCLGSANQQWLFKDGYFASALNTNKCVDAGPSMLKGFELMLWECNGYPQQQWGYDADAKRVYLTQSGDGSLCLDVPGGDVKDGATLFIWDCLDVDSQKFTQLAGDTLDFV